MSLAQPTASVSSLASIMVPVDLGPDSENRIKVAGSLADRFSSQLIGIAAEEPIVPYYMEGGIGIDETVLEIEESNLREDFSAAEKMFRQAAGQRNAIEWRCGRALPFNFVAKHARAADLVVVTRRRTEAPFAGRMAVDAADLVIDVGRPILILPPETSYLSAKNVIVAWKNTREARRAVSDALPFLKRAKDVIVASIGPEASRQDATDVSTHLNRHGVLSQPLTREIVDGRVSEELISLAGEEGADLIVCGAYGHSRMREWVMGGVTRSLIEGTSVPCLMSH